MNSPVWVSGWHAPLLNLTKAAIHANRDDTHDLHRLVDDLFSQPLLVPILGVGLGGLAPPPDTPVSGGLPLTKDDFRTHRAPMPPPHMTARPNRPYGDSP